MSDSWQPAKVWTVACQAPLSMGFPRQEYWSGLPFPSPRDLSTQRSSLYLPATAGGFFTTEPPRKPQDLSAYQYKSPVHLSFLPFPNLSTKECNVAYF